LLDPVLRRATDSDAQSVDNLVASAYEKYIPLIGRTPMPMLTDHRESIRANDVWVLDVEGTLVGVLELHARVDHVWIDNVAIEPTWQRRGLGRRLLQHAEDEARRIGLAEMRLLTNERYVANIAMYTRHGYVETHREPHLGTDLVYFAKTIGDAPG
jgi:GNAT superfamily N-acetyltransferase